MGDSVLQGPSPPQLPPVEAVRRLDHVFLPTPTTELHPVRSGASRAQ